MKKNFVIWVAALLAAVAALAVEVSFVSAVLRGEHITGSFWTPEGLVAGIVAAGIVLGAAAVTCVYFAVRYFKGR